VYSSKKTSFFLLVFFFSVLCVGITDISAAPKRKNSLSLKNFLDNFNQQTNEPARAEQAPPPSGDKGENKIDAINIEGLVNIPQSVVLDELGIRPGDTFNTYKLASVVKNISALGMFSEVKTSIQDGKTGKKITFIITERPLISAVQFEGNTVLTKAELMAVVESKEKEVLNLQTIKKDIERLNELYQEKGYADSRILSVKTPETESEPLIFRMAEKTVSEITITGNRVTRPYVILREMDTKPGDVLHIPTLKEDLRKVFNLGYFTDLRPQFLPGKTPYLQTLQLDVTEKQSFGSFQFGGSYGQTAGGSVFSNLSWENLGGTAQTVMLTAQFSLGGTGGTAPYNIFQFKYFNPWMWDARKSFSFKTWYRTGKAENFLLNNSTTVAQDETSFGTEVGFGIPLNYQTRFEHYVKYEYVIPSQNIGKPYSVQSYKWVGSYDTRDYIFNPQEGVFYTMSIERGLPLFPTSFNFTRYDLDLRHFFRVVDQQVLATRLAFGLLDTPHDINPSSSSSPFARELYRVGGANTVRGYDDLSPFAYGNKQVLATIEYRFLFTDAFQLILFGDAGYAPNFVNDDATRSISGVPFMGRFRTGKGIGTRITVPMLGSIRLDFGIDDRGNSRLHFNMGNTF
jgi:outer membrane protein insertion porin family